VLLFTRFSKYRILLYANAILTLIIPGVLLLSHAVPPFYMLYSGVIVLALFFIYKLKCLK
jgi:hypothetical protein